MSTTKEWFATWFDTPYYHILYKNRNDKEAQDFMDKLVAQLKLNNDNRCLDLACGKGRHAKYLNSIGLNVVGLDLSPNSILQAQKFSNERLQFDVHDMREVYKENYFDVVFNLFTSFGYFDNEDENQKVINSIYEMLTPQGILVIDFMNVNKVIQQLVKEERKEVEGIQFDITRVYDGNHIFKTISFTDDKNEKNTFTERVQALSLPTFERLLEKGNFELTHRFGNYQLDPFDKDSSDRLILIAKKK